MIKLHLKSIATNPKIHIQIPWQLTHDNSAMTTQWQLTHDNSPMTTHH